MYVNKTPRPWNLYEKCETIKRLCQFGGGFFGIFLSNRDGMYQHNSRVKPVLF